MTRDYDTDNKLQRGAAKPKGLRMKDLSAATGLPKSAILHYVAQGLLPEPIKTSANMAFYDPACIEQIGFIRAMQEKYAFPLNKIKTLLSHMERGMDVTPLIELSATIFGDADAKTLNEVDLCQAAGISAKELHMLIKNGLIIPIDKGKFTQQDVTVCGIYARCLESGAGITDLTFYVKAAKMIVDGEMHVRRKLTAHLLADQDAELTRRMVMGARVLRSYVIDRTFQQRVASATSLKDASLLTGKRTQKKDDRASGQSEPTV